MVNNERQSGILQLLETNECLTVQELCRHFYASASTIRRDLAQLEQSGYLRRTRGGATRIQPVVDLPFELRTQNSPTNKEALARRAVELIRDGDCLYLDSSSTVARMVPHLARFHDLTIVTNGIRAATELEQLHKFRVLCTGGLLLWNARSYVGPYAREMVAQFRFDQMFFSAGGVSPEYGVFDASMEHVDLLQQALSCTQAAILLADKKKFQKIPGCRICTWDQIQFLVTDAPIQNSFPKPEKLICI